MIILSDGETPVASSSESAIARLEDDDTSVKARSSSTEHDMRHNANLWYSIGADGDVQTATRKAEEQMRGADDAVDEVHEDSPAGQTQNCRGNEIGDGMNSDRTSTVPIDTGSDIFPGGSIESATDSSIGHHEPIHTIEAPAFSGVQVETTEGRTSRLDKRKPIYHDARSVQQAGNSALPKIQTIQSNAEESDNAAVNGHAGIPTDRPVSMFPGGSLVPDGVKQVTTKKQLQIPTLSKKRNLPTGSEDLDIHLRPPKPSNQA